MVGTCYILMDADPFWHSYLGNSKRCNKYVDIIQTGKKIPCKSDLKLKKVFILGFGHL
jgi:hypothetical protein